MEHHLGPSMELESAASTALNWAAVSAQGSAAMSASWLALGSEPGLGPSWARATAPESEGSMESRLGPTWARATALQ